MNRYSTISNIIHFQNPKKLIIDLSTLINRNPKPPPTTINTTSRTLITRNWKKNYSTTPNRSSTPPSSSSPPMSPSPQKTSHVSPHIGFYQKFGRPIAKVFLLAMVTYQSLYWIWLKLETVEIQNEKTKEITRLEQEIQKHLEDSQILHESK